jgi:hypothetical protein
MSGDRDQSAAQWYEVMRQEIDRRFSMGTFVAVERGRVVADAENHRTLVEKLQSQGKSPKGMLIVQAGVSYPESAEIFAAFLARRCYA